MTTQPSAPDSTGAGPRSKGWRAGAGRLVTDALVPASGIGRRLAGIAVIDSLGSGMFYAGSALYFTNVVGLSAGQVGLGLSLAGLAGLLGAVPLGILADKVRAGRVYVGLQLWRGLGYAAYCVTNSFALFAVVACCIGLADTAVPPVSQAVVSAVVSPAERVDTLAKIRAARNVGFGVGALVATAGIQISSNWGFTTLVAGNAVSFAICALLLQRAGVTRLDTVAAPSTARRPTLTHDARYVGVAVLNGLLSMHLTLLPLALPLWISHHTRVPIGVYGPLYVLNTVMAVVLQARFARPADKLPGAVASLRWAGYALAGFAVACWAMGRIHTVWIGVLLAILAAVLVTCTELLQSAGGWTISYELARPDRRAQYLATFQLGTALQSIAAPAMLTALVLPHTLGWPVFAVGAVLVGLAVHPIVRHHPVVAAQLAGESDGADSDGAMPAAVAEPDATASAEAGTVS
ncbi:MFS transporter [Actinacidiphila acididurans]|uniref:MFS transporter n=1 Tax=Actinacidiphila acididurans TaxID=2784346 RepID=A0ABS2TLB1_9ACTN|nr:MFS transporter [Actinacidiphila acididurans]MBM9504120.1 MFS transporter [Actinacidiphila acididurans]